MLACTSIIILKYDIVYQNLYMKGMRKMAITTGSSTGSTNSSRSRRRNGEGLVNLRFNPTNDAILSVFVAGSIFPCVMPPVSPGPLPTPTPAPVPEATAFIGCLLANDYEIRYMEVLTPTDVFVTLARYY